MGSALISSWQMAVGVFGHVAVGRVCTWFYGVCEHQTPGGSTVEKTKQNGVDDELPVGLSSSIGRPDGPFSDVNTPKRSCVRSGGGVGSLSEPGKGS